MEHGCFRFDIPAGFLVCSIDNMPAQMPLEATKYFGNLLMPFVYEMVRSWFLEGGNGGALLVLFQLESDATKPFEQFDASPVVKNVRSAESIWDR